MLKLSRIALMLIACCLVADIAEARWRPFQRIRNRGGFRYSASANYSFSATTPQALAEEKAALLASMNSGFHPGGGYAGANAEGFGVSNTAAGALGNCCFTGQRAVAGQAVVQGSNGLWYAIKIYW